MRTLIAIALSVAVACGGAKPEFVRLRSRPVTPTVKIEPGEHPLGPSPGWVHGVGFKRGGILHVPRQTRTATPLPLLLLLHGGGGRSDDFSPIFPLAEEFGVVIAALDSRDNTWDAIDSPWGPDVVSVDAALDLIFHRVAIDPARVALGGVSDGGFYALSLGLANGDLFTHVIAIAPGYYRLPAPPIGRPRILVAHGSRDTVYSVTTSLRIVPELKTAGYDTTFREFDGPHSLPVPVARDALAWLLR